MSCSQSTLADRTPSILNKDHPPDKKPKNDKSPASLKHEFDPTGLVQRCVIIQRDENGFGLTVSGDNPVFVQLVREDGAAMRAGVQTGDRIIKVNGTLVTHSNHKEVVELIKSGSYVALTVLGRPPGLLQITMEDHKEEEQEEEEKGGDEPWSAALPDKHWDPPSSSGPTDPIAPPLHLGDGVLTASPVLEEGEYADSGTSRTDRGHATQCDGGSDDASDYNSQCTMGGPSFQPNPQIIGAEDDYFDAQQEQIHGQCGCFQSIEALTTRPAHLATFLHHVVSQFDPAPLLCYLYADLHRQASSKESRRLFIDFHTLFMDRAANLKVAVPESIAAELEKRRLELIPEELCKQYSQQLQDALLPDVYRNLEDFRQKRSMGLTLAEEELCKLDAERGGASDVRGGVCERGAVHLTLEKERSCAERIVSKIEEILLTSPPAEEEKCTAMQYVVLSYMKHLGVKVKEPRCLEPKRPRLPFLPKIKKSIKPEKEGEEKVKKTRFSNILGQPRRPSRVESMSVGKALELSKQRLPRQQQAAANSIPEHQDTPSGRVRGSQASDSSDAGAARVSPVFAGSPLPLNGVASAGGLLSDASGQDSDSGFSPSFVTPRQGEAPSGGESQDSTSSPTASLFDFSPGTAEQMQEEEQEPRMEGLPITSPADAQSEEDRGSEVRRKEDPLDWQRLVSREVLAGLTPLEIKRQEVFNELLHTERAHLRMLRVLDSVFYQRLSRDGILPIEDVQLVFANLEEIIQLHVSITEQMMAVRQRSETSVIGQIGDDLLSLFSGEEEEKIQNAVGTFCRNQPSALELIKSRQKKDQRFTAFMQEAESNRMCRRLQLKDMIPVEMQRLTKYPLLLGNIAKYTEDDVERVKVARAGECCKKILNHVNQAVKEAENKQRLEEYQRRLDLSSLKQSDNPMILEFKNLDLTKRKMIHEGPLSWKVNKDKTIELYTILLEDILVLLQKQDERLVLKCHSKNLSGAADTKHIFSPIIKLNTVMVRPVATDNKSFFVISMSDNGIYELMAQTISERRTWQCMIIQCADAMKTKPHTIIPLSPTDADRDALEIMSPGIDKPSRDAPYSSTAHTESPDTNTASSLESPAPPTTLSSYECVRSDNDDEEEEEEEELVALEDRGEDQEVVDEEELEAFLGGGLVDRLPFLQGRSRQGIAIGDQEHMTFDIPFSRAEEALRTLALLKQVLLDHMVHTEETEGRGDPDDGRRRAATGTPDRLLRTSIAGSVEPGDTGAMTTGASSAADEGVVDDLFEPVALGNGYATLDCYAASEDSSAEDDVAVGDLGIDLKKMLSSSSQTGGGGPNLQRQLMTHLRLIQANLQDLKEVEIKYNQLRKTLNETTTDDNIDRIQ